MFGRQDLPAQDAAQIPDQSINNALGDDQPAGNDSWQHPGTPLDDNQSAPQAPQLTVTPPAGPPVSDDDQDDDQPADQPTYNNDDHSDDTVKPQGVDSNDLIDIKQQALSQLGPLVGHLDQSPEEKFRTTMMMIQASDDQSLLRTAYEAAQQIQDEKTRAQALLDIINEINYFTQHNSQ